MRAREREDHWHRGRDRAEDATLRLDHLQTHVVEFRKVRRTAIGEHDAAEAPDPNDVIAKLNAAATQATANFLQVMTLPLSAPVAPVRRCLRVI